MPGKTRDYRPSRIVRLMDMAMDRADRPIRPELWLKIADKWGYHVDVVIQQFDAQRVEEPVQRVLGGAVRGAVRHPVFAGHR